MGHYSITIGRDFGSGGKEIAKIIAEKLNYIFYDDEILALAAKESGFSETLFEQHDEKHGHLHNLIFSKMPIIGQANYYSEQVTQSSLFKFQSEVILKAANKGNCVFVGRGADYILRNRPKIIKIFIYADMPYKIKRVMEREHISQEAARKLIVEKERSRADYYNFYTGKTWGEKGSYDLCINTSELGVERTAEILINLIKYVTQ